MNDIMNEKRRVLYNTLTQEDIPSSAIELTSDNYTTVSGNVLYIPRNGYNGTNYNTNSSDYMISINAGTSSNKIISIDDTRFDITSIYAPGQQSPSYNSIRLHGYVDPYMHLNEICVRYSSSYGFIGIGIGLLSDSNLSLPAVIKNNDVIYYDVIKYTNTISMSSVGNKVFTNYPPIYIDTEN